MVSLSVALMLFSRAVMPTTIVPMHCIRPNLGMGIMAFMAFMPRHGM